MIMDKLWIISLILSTAHKTTSKSKDTFIDPRNFPIIWLQENAY